MTSVNSVIYISFERNVVKDKYSSLTAKELKRNAIRKALNVYPRILDDTLTIISGESVRGKVGYSKMIPSCRSC